MRPTKTSHSFEVKGNEVKFTSNFDSGNLRNVTQTGEHSFTIESSYDTYEIPSSNKSFFHFRVENYPKGEHISMTIKNLSLLDCIKAVHIFKSRKKESFIGLVSATMASTIRECLNNRPQFKVKKVLPL